MKRRNVLLRLVALGIAPLTGLSACGGGGSSSGGGGGGAPLGKATVTGNVSSTTTPGGISGISVSIDNVFTNTNSAGMFSLPAIEPGLKTLQFTSGTSVATLAVSVAPDTTVMVPDVAIANGTATSGGISSGFSQSSSGSSGSSGTSGTSGNDDDSDLSGTSGTSGTAGTSGGNDDDSDLSGTSGTSGTSGEDDDSDSNGTSGTSGTGGDDDDSGSSGSSGTSGSSGG